MTDRIVITGFTEEQKDSLMSNLAAELWADMEMRIEQAREGKEPVHPWIKQGCTVHECDHQGEHECTPSCPTFDGKDQT